MRKRDTKRISTVRGRILYFNALMTVTVIAACLLIGVVCVNIYWKREEDMLRNAVNGMLSGEETEELIRRLTIWNNWFNVVFAVFAVLSVVTLIVVNRFFAAKLTQWIMNPLDLLCAAAERVQNNDYSVPIVYRGELEFKRVCETFNSMQQHLKSEKEKNAWYEKADARQRIIIQDNGVGVPAELTGQIFDEFYRADESRNKKEGSGLGLYIVKYLSEAMGGRGQRVEADSVRALPLPAADDLVHSRDDGRLAVCGRDGADHAG